MHHNLHPKAADASQQKLGLGMVEQSRCKPLDLVRVANNAIVPAMLPRTTETATLAAAAAALGYSGTAEIILHNHLALEGVLRLWRNSAAKKPTGLVVMVLALGVVKHKLGVEIDKAEAELPTSLLGLAKLAPWERGRDLRRATERASKIIEGAWPKIMRTCADHERDAA